MGTGEVAVHAHFYQPARHDPFTGRIPPDASAAPFHDWNDRIAHESYGANAAAGNFGRIGWDLGPTLARWLRRERPDVHARIAAQADGRNAMAQAFHHTILPLASRRDRRTEIRWGLRDFELRFGYRPRGIWLPETAVDLATLRDCAEEGLAYTILAPWQAAAAAPSPERRQPTAPEPPPALGRVDVGDDRSLVVAFYDAPLSAAVSFEPDATADADRFARERIGPRLADLGTRPDSRPLVIATDGELYGHHQPFRDLFLARLTRLGPAPAHDGPMPPDAAATPSLETRTSGDPSFAVTTVGHAVEAARHLALPAVAVRERTSWSCHHGVLRWSAECPDAADGRWKAPLRSALDALAARVDTVTEDRLGAHGIDAWAARDRYADVASEFTAAAAWADDELARVDAGRATRAETGGRREDLLTLMAAQASRLAMFASDGWFWEDPRRPETAQVLRFAAHAARLIDGRFGTALERAFVDDLAAVPPTGLAPDGAALYRGALAAIGQPPPA